MISRLTRSASGAAASLHVRSALNPALWLCAIALPCCFGYAAFFDGWIRGPLVIAGCVVLFLTMAVLVYFAFRHPDKLQSAGYQIRKQAFELIEEKGHRIPVRATSIEAITSPDNLSSDSESSDGEGRG